MSLSRAIGLLLVAYVAMLVFSVLPLPKRLPAPDVALLVALHAGLTCRLSGGPAASLRDASPAAMAAFGFCLGYLADLVSGGIRGLYALGLALLVVVLRSAATHLLVRGAGFIMAISAATAVVFGLLLSLLRAWADPETARPGLRGLLAQVAVTALCAPPIFYLLGKADARFWQDGRERGLTL